MVAGGGTGAAMRPLRASSFSLDTQTHTFNELGHPLDPILILIISFMSPSGERRGEVKMNGGAIATTYTHTHRRENSDCILASHLVSFKCPHNLPSPHTRPVESISCGYF